MRIGGSNYRWRSTSRQPGRATSVFRSVLPLHTIDRSGCWPRHWLYKKDCFTLALTAALVGSQFVATEAANEAMIHTLIDFREECKARALDMETRLRAPQPDTPTVRRTIDDVLDDNPDR